MIDSVYGQTMENLRKRIRLVNNEKDFLKYTSKPTLTNLCWVYCSLIKQMIDI